MKETSTARSHPEHESQHATKLTNINITVSGSGQPVLTHGTGHVTVTATGKTLSCNGRLVPSQNFDLDGIYDIKAAEAKYLSAPYLGTSAQDPPWKFDVGAAS